MIVDLLIGLWQRSVTEHRLIGFSHLRIRKELQRKRYIDLKSTLNAKERVSSNLAGNKNERKRKRDGRNAIQ